MLYITCSSQGHVYYDEALSFNFFQGGDVGYIMYNDQPPKQKTFEGASRICGHTKGAVNCYLRHTNAHLLCGSC